MRKHITTQYYGKTIAALAGMYATASLFYGDDDDFSLTFDPRSSDFGKIVLGDVRIDPLAGLAQTLRFGVQASTGQRVNAKGEVEDLRGPKAKFGRADIVSNFLRSKAAPGPGQVWDWIAGRRLDGSTPTVANTLGNIGMPITYGDIKDVLTSELNVPEKSALSIMSIFGLGVAVYEKREKEKKSGKLVF
jgi:hypothetical protein